LKEKLWQRSNFNINHMSYIKEPKGVDFLIKSEALTNADRRMISEHILTNKRSIRFQRQRGR
jgi:hypothetical protein